MDAMVVPESVPDKLRKLRERTPMSVQDVADELSHLRGSKVPKSTYAHYESKKFKGKFIPADLAQDLAKLFGNHGIAAGDLLRLAGLAGDKNDVSVATTNLTVQPLPGSAMAPTGDQDLRILGHAKGGEDAFFIDNGEIAGFTMRPNILKGVTDAYAVIFHDRSMEPALKHGHMGWVHPRRPTKPGDDVVVQFNDGQALVKELVRRTDKEVVLKQHNPPKEIRVKRADVKAIHLIVMAGRVPM